VRVSRLLEPVDFVQQVIGDFIRHQSATFAAAISYYTVFSLAPILLIVIVVAGLFITPQQATDALNGQFAGLIGPDGAEQIRTMIEHVRSNPEGSQLARVLGGAVALFGATGVLAQLQNALNRTWEVAPDPLQGGSRSFLVKRLLSFAMILVIAFLLLVSLVLNAVLSAIIDRASVLLPIVSSAYALRTLDTIVSFFVITVLFAAMFKWLPEARIRWRDVALGALFTSAIFTIGKNLIGVYLGNSNVSTIYGTASSLAILLVWIYFSSIVVLLGAEFTHVWTQRYGERIVPEEGATFVKPVRIRWKKKVRWPTGTGGGMRNTFLRRKRNWVLLIVGTLLIGLIALRLALPSIVKSYANRKLDEHEVYDGHIEDVDIALIRGAYTIEGIEIVKETGAVPEPLFAADAVDLSIAWKSLFKGSLVGEIEVYSPRVNFVNGDSPEEDQSGAEGEDEDWRETVRDLFPTRIDRLAIYDGEIHYVDKTASPAIDVMLNDVEAEALNLTNSDKISDTLAATLHARAYAQDTGDVALEALFDPYAELPTFDGNIRVTGVELVRFNKLIDRFVKFDLEQGRMDLNVELAAVDGAIEGYIKPILHDVKVVERGEFKEDKEGPVRAAWEVVAGAAKGVLNNEKKDQLATRIPISGRLDQPDVPPWPVIGSALYNGFIEALTNGLENTVNISDVGDGVPPARDASDGRQAKEEKKEEKEEKQEKRKERKEKRRGRTQR
jgi:YihY family inner membrane protein